MTKYIDFSTSEQGHLLVEVDERDLPVGVARAGLRDVANKAVYGAQALFEDAIKAAVRVNVETFYDAIQALSHPPTDIEIAFGLKASGELGNVVISKINAEANYTVKLSWKSVNKTG